MPVADCGPQPWRGNWSLEPKKGMKRAGRVIPQPKALFPLRATDPVPEPRPLLVSSSKLSLPRVRGLRSVASIPHKWYKDDYYR